MSRAGRTRVWTCDNCGKRATWGKGWRWFAGVPSRRNRHPTLVCPWSVCSETCANASCEMWQREFARYTQGVES